MAEPKLNYTIQGQSLLISDDYNLPKYTVLIGKNNSGKSRLLVALYEKLPGNEQSPLPVFYISPERFGELTRSSGIEDANSTNRYGRDREKLKNQSPDFITDALSSFNGLINQLNRPPANEKILSKILKNLNGKISGVNFSYTTNAQHTSYNFLINGNIPNPSADRFSSGTNQIIALMTQIMFFVYSGRYSDDAILLLDEPDVHIHPDLQIEFVKFIVDVTKDTKHKLMIATHSSSIISGFTSQNDAYVATKNNNKLIFSCLNNELQRLLPSLGSHSLSHVFNNAPLLLVEGEDDQTVWQYAVRHSSKKLNFHIVEAGSKDNLTSYENLVNEIAPQLFQSPVAYEIRDRDCRADGALGQEEIDDKGVVLRSKTHCKEIENLVLSNEVLLKLGYNDWESAKYKLSGSEFKNINRYSADIAPRVQRLIMILMEDNHKSWEVLVGSTIGRYINDISNLKDIEGSIFHMLGPKICKWLEEII